MDTQPAYDPPPAPDGIPRPSWDPVQARLAEYRPSATRALVAQFLLGTTVALLGVTTLLNLWLLPLMDAVDANAVDFAQLRLHDGLVEVVALAYSAAFIASAVAFLAWLWRAVKNLYPLTGERGEFSPGAAVGWWFAPLVNFVMPYRIVDELLVRAAPGSPGWTVVAWWILYLGSNIANIAVTSASRTLDTPDALRAFVGTAMVYLLPRIVSGVLLLWIIRRVETGLAAAAARAGVTGALPGPAPAWGPGFVPLAAPADGPLEPPPPTG